MEKIEFEKILREALNYIYSEKKLLIDNETHERTIVAEIKARIESRLSEFDVNVEYNREGKDGNIKMVAGRRIIPDLIIHKMGEISGPNFAAIQFKGHWNLENRSKDENDLRELRDKFTYQFLYRVEFLADRYEIIPLVE